MMFYWQKWLVIFCLDRAGLVGPDGPTHHGVFDISLMNALPGIIIAAIKKSLVMS